MEERWVLQYSGKALACQNRLIPYDRHWTEVRPARRFQDQQGLKREGIEERIVGQFSDQVNSGIGSRWMSSFVESRWGSGIVVAKGRVIKPVELEGFAAFKGKNPLGLLTYRIEGLDCEIVTIDSDIEDVGIGTALIDAVRKKAKAKGCRRLWLVTTNDKVKALGFYQKRGFQITAIYPHAIEKARKLKPQIPMQAANGIPIRDELELELELSE
jgi:hypothetical protein